MSDIAFRELRNNAPMLVNFAKAVARARVKPGNNPQLPAIGLRLRDVIADARHVDSYRKVCGFARGDRLPITYPHMLAFPMHMALMLNRKFPFPAMGLVHIRNAITEYRPIDISEQLDIEVSLGRLERVDKGYEFAVITQISTAGELVWESESVNFYRHGKSLSKKRKPAPVEAVTGATEWTIPGDIGRRYGAVSGDRNPIHLYPLTAKLFGFKRQIAHGMWTKARCLAALESDLPQHPFCVDVSFKLPVFTPAKVLFSRQDSDAGIDFHLLAKDGIKPHLDGHIRSIDQ